MKRLLLWLAVSLMAGGCNKFDDPNLQPTTEIEVPATIYASFEKPATDSRTYIEGDRYIRWSAADELSYFPGVACNTQYRFKGESGAAEGVFERVTSGAVTGARLDCCYAVYPYDAATSIVGDGELSFNLPATQSYAENSFGLGANTMIAATQNLEDATLHFKNACGYLKLQLYGDDVIVKSIEFKGNNNEKIAGAATIVAAHGSNPVVKMDDAATTTITLDCGKGVQLSNNSASPTVFWLVIPAQTFEKGFTVTITDIHTYQFTKSTSYAIPIDRNTIQPMKAVKVVCESPVPENQIWYTATTKIEPEASDYYTFGAWIQSNEWDAETQRGVITFDSDVTTIGAYTFYTNALTGIELPDCITTIEERAFAASKLKSIIIPKGVTTIEPGAFSTCTELTAFYGKLASEDNGCLILDGKLVAFAGGRTEYVIPDGVTAIEASTFANCSNLTNIVIPEGVTSIGESAFYGCHALRTITLPQSISTIGSSAFYNCGNLSTVICKAITPPALGRKAFDVNASDRKIYVYEECLQSYQTQWSNYAESIVSAGSYPTVTTIYYTTSDGQIVEPDKLVVRSNTYSDGQGKLVVLDTAISGSAFYGCETLTTVQIEGATEIGSWAFYYCSNLTHVTVGEGVTSIGEYAFDDCYALQSVILPDGVVSIEKYTFASCSKLSEFSIPKTVTSIGEKAFISCSALTEINIPEGVVSIDDYAFFGCSGLTEITIPDSVVSIGNRAFKECNKMSRLMLGAGLKSIGEMAFYNCIDYLVYDAISVYCKAAQPPILGADVFKCTINERVYSYIYKVYTPTASVDSYKAAVSWKDYADAIEGYDFSAER